MAMKTEKKEILNPLLKMVDKSKLLVKYLENIDSKIYKKAALPRFLSIFSNHKEYLEDSFSSFYNFIELNLEQKANDVFILSTLEIILKKMLDDNLFPNEDKINELINLLGKEYEPINAKFICEIMIDIFINTEYHELFKITNSKLGKIIFYKKSLFTN